VGYVIILAMQKLIYKKNITKLNQMKSKHLKNRSEYVKEHFAAFFNDRDNSETVFSQFGADTEEEAPESDLVDNSEVVVDEPQVNVATVSVTSEPKMDMGILDMNPSEVANQLPQNVTTGMLVPEPAICDPMSNNFAVKQDWCVIKCMTTNGIRIGLDKQSETECEVLAGNLSYNDAISKVEEVASQQGCPVFNDDMDEYVGRVSKAYIKKPIVSNTVSPTSYKPTPNSYGSSENSFKGAL
jgi:hypothetical protein